MFLYADEMKNEITTACALRHDLAKAKLNPNKQTIPVILEDSKKQDENPERKPEISAISQSVNS